MKSTFKGFFPLQPFEKRLADVQQMQLQDAKMRLLDSEAQVDYHLGIIESCKKTINRLEPQREESRNISA